METNESRRCVAEMKVAQQELAELLDGIFSDLDQLCAGVMQHAAALSTSPQPNRPRTTLTTQMPSD